MIVVVMPIGSIAVLPVRDVNSPSMSPQQQQQAAAPCPLVESRQGVHNVRRLGRHFAFVAPPYPGR